MKKDLNTTFPFGVLLILDGWGEASYSEYNAVKLAHTPHMDYLYNHGYSTFLGASGEDVGLPNGTIGNSEVGHLNIGGGRVVMQEVLKINSEITNGKFFHNPVLRDGIQHAIDTNKSIHIIGLLSDASVHSSNEHAYAILKLCADMGVHDRVYIHAITDGRDTPVDSSYRYITELQVKMQLYHVGEIASVMGRYYAMDRDQRWDRVEKAYHSLLSPDEPIFDNPFDGIRTSYNDHKTDEFILPFHVKVKEMVNAQIHDGDTVIFFNFREDRARELTISFLKPDFHEFPIQPIHPYFITMTEYENGLCEHIAYEPEKVEGTLSEILSLEELYQFKIAETEKYAHVTYFFNGGREVEFPLEDRYMIPSLKIPTFDLEPQMRAREIADELVKRIESKKYKLLVANLANADMVGHTGNLQATIKACEVVDSCVGKVYEEVIKFGGFLIITADHGNAEVKYLEDRKQISTSHTCNPVPFIYTSPFASDKIKVDKGRLGDVAPTILNRLGLMRSAGMTGRDLLHTYD